MTITTGSEVKFAGQLTSEYTDEEILSEIDLVESMLYDKYSLPKKSSFTINDDFSTFYFSDSNVHEIIRVQVQVDTSIDPTGYLSIGSTGSTWDHVPQNRYFTLDPTFKTTYEGKKVRVQYIPDAYHRMATYQTALNLVDTTSIIDGQRVTTPLAQRITDKLNYYRNMVRPQFGILRSSLYVDYDENEYVDFDGTKQADLR